MKFLHFFLLLVVLTNTFKGFAQVGSYDSEFSEDGYVRTSIGALGSYGTCVALQPDGKILFGGPCWDVNGKNNFGLGRLLQNGNYDNNFAGDGRMSLDLGSDLDWLTSMTVRPDGKITTFGRNRRVTPYAYGFAFAQFKSDGTVDSTFGTNGVVKSFLTGRDEPTSMEIQDDGKMVVAGYSFNSSNIPIIARYLKTGQLDFSFSNNGYILDADVANWARVQDIIIQDDGKIIIAGYTQPDPNDLNTDIFLKRYHIDGTDDVTFGDAGLVIGDFVDSSSSNLFAVTLQSDGKIIVVGRTQFPNHTVVARFNTDGGLDFSFGSNGVTILDTEGIGILLNAVYPLSDGKILLTGGMNSDNGNGSESDIYLSRILANGRIDSTFGVAGIQYVSILQGGDIYTDEEANAITVQPDGKIILVGTSGHKSFVSRHLTELHVGLLDFTAEAVAPLIYPNPIVETATLQYELSEATAITVELYDLQGKRILTLLPETEQAEGKYELPVVLPSHLTSGAYVLSVSNGKGRVAVQVIKQ
jgi:uncharacterized delta-60 repeat protein